MTEAMEDLATYYAGISRDGGLISKCEMWLPPMLEGATVLDIECRRGKGVYKLSEHVGQSGQALGVDTDAAFIEDAIAHEAENLVRNHLTVSNMCFRQAFPENLAAAGIEDGSVDVVNVNSWLNLAYDRVQVLREIYRVLKPGGEFYHAGLFVDNPYDSAARAKALTDGDAYGTATTFDAFCADMAQAGFDNYFVIDGGGNQPIGGRWNRDGRHFSPLVIRSFKLAGSADGPGRNVVYQGGIPPFLGAFVLDDAHSYPAGTPVATDAATARVFTESRYAAAFAVADR